jgi:hypothetical protein
MLSEMLQQLAVEGKNRFIETLPSNVCVVAKTTTTTTTTMMKEENLSTAAPKDRMQKRRFFNMARDRVPTHVKVKAGESRRRKASPSVVLLIFFAER